VEEPFNDIPAKAGIQSDGYTSWISAFAGMTIDGYRSLDRYLFINQNETNETNKR
jgi:hypothetical protein